MFVEFLRKLWNGDKEDLQSMAISLQHYRREIPSPNILIDYAIYPLKEELNTGIFGQAQNFHHSKWPALQKTIPHIYHAGI